LARACPAAAHEFESIGKSERNWLARTANGDVRKGQPAEISFPRGRLADGETKLRHRAPVRRPASDSIRNLQFLSIRT
jgi:hypothetical protein